jgi:hypothetical protein
MNVEQFTRQLIDIAVKNGEQPPQDFVDAYLKSLRLNPQAEVPPTAYEYGASPNNDAKESPDPYFKGSIKFAQDFVAAAHKLSGPTPTPTELHRMEMFLAGALSAARYFGGTV